MKNILSFVSLLLFSCNAIGQTPYFQQTVNYTIAVELDDVQKMLRGSIEMEYHNASPHVLDEIYILTMPNAYQKGTALHDQLLVSGKVAALLDQEDNRGFCDSLFFTQNGRPVSFENVNNQLDVQRIQLHTPLQPGEKTTIKTPFRVKLPNAEISRLGHIENDYMITQWYPKPAVYDRNGWHPYPYLTQGEFYSEFGAFDVSITLPENYFVGATGMLLNDEEWERIAEREAATKDGSFKGDDSPSAEAKKTLRYKQDNIHDFAFFASKSFFVETKDFNIGNRSVKAIAMYQKANKKLWKDKGVDYIVNATQFYSKEVGDYPYDYVTAVDGTIAAGGGMEYPMVTVIGSMGSGKMLDKVIAHEVGHNWFYGILGSDERRYPFMDEGMNSHVESMYMQHFYPNENLAGNAKIFGLDKWKDKDQYYLAYRIVGSWNEDQPMNAPAPAFSNTNYGLVVYMKSAVAFQHLRGYLGEEAFLKAMHLYYNTWKFKHPAPEDLQATFEESTGKDLSWFFEDIVGSTKKVDYKIVSTKVLDGKFQVTLKNKGNVSAPLPLTFANDTTRWLEGFTGKKTFEFPADWAEPIIHNKNNNSLDLVLENDATPSTRKLSFKFLPMLEHREENRQVLLPVMGFNSGDPFYLGLGIHNRSFFGKKFEYYIAPAFGFRSNSLVGLAGFNYNYFTPKTDWLSRISLETETSRFFTTQGASPSLYNRINPNLIFHLRTKDRSTNFNHKAGIRFRFIEDIQRLGDENLEARNWYTANEAFYSFSKSNYNRSHAGYIGVEWISDLSETTASSPSENSTTTKIFGSYVYEKRYWKEKHVKTRLFAGAMAPTSTRSPYNFRLNGWDGQQDYRLDEFFFNRGGNRTQFLDNEGGFLVFTQLQAHSVLTSGRITLELPYVPLISVYAEGALMNRENSANAMVWDSYFSSGLLIELIPNAFSIGLPLINNSRLEDHVSDLQPKLWNRVRFMINIRAANPYKSLRSLL
ncbi:MAG: M1 family metallopeptidase [Schleiferiaceae bacterium]|nr:M1 family metallopeptidase [Schleiferiaceae bacterium]